jgi:hypothetical protein
MASLSCNISPRTAGTICQERPYLCQPAAFPRSSAVDEAVPQLVHFFPRRAGHEETDPRREGELRATVQRNELLTIELECHGHDRSVRTGPCIAVTHDTDDSRALKNGGIEIRRLLGLAVEPKERPDFCLLLTPGLRRWPSWQVPPGPCPGSLRPWGLSTRAAEDGLGHSVKIPHATRLMRRHNIEAVTGGFQAIERGRR